MLVTKNVLNRCNHSLLVGSLFLSPLFFTKRAFDDKKVQYFRQKKAYHQSIGFRIPYGRELSIT